MTIIFLFQDDSDFNDFVENMSDDDAFFQDDSDFSDDDDSEDEENELPPGFNCAQS